jgi:hypothetical protein
MADHGQPLRYTGRGQANFWDEPGVERGKDTGSLDYAPGIFSDWPTRDQPFPRHLSPWDAIYFNDVRAPGPVRLRGGRHIPYDRKAALGQLVGAPAFFVFDPVQFDLTLTLWHPDQFIELQELLPQIMPDPGPNPTPRAVRAQHPALQLLKVDTIYVESMEMPQFRPAPNHQIADIVFQCYEFRPPIPATVQDIGSPLPSKGQPGGQKPSPRAAAPPSADPGALGPGLGQT